MARNGDQGRHGRYQTYCSLCAPYALVVLLIGLTRAYFDFYNQSPLAPFLSQLKSKVNVAIIIDSSTSVSTMELLLEKEFAKNAVASFAARNLFGM